VVKHSYCHARSHSHCENIQDIELGGKIWERFGFLKNVCPELKLSDYETYLANAKLTHNRGKAMFFETILMTAFSQIAAGKQTFQQTTPALQALNAQLAGGKYDSEFIHPYLVEKLFKSVK
jgi:hypothetical protein